MWEVWKYPLPPPCDAFEIEAPLNAEWLDVQLQNGKPVMWALVTPKNGIRRYQFIWRGTGHAIEPDSYRHVGTFQMGALVFHIFEKQ